MGNIRHNAKTISNSFIPVVISALTIYLIENPLYVLSYQKSHIFTTNMWDPRIFTHIRSDPNCIPNYSFLYKNGTIYTGK